MRRRCTIAAAFLVITSLLGSAGAIADGPDSALAFLDVRSAPPTVAIALPPASRLTARETVAIEASGRRFDKLRGAARPPLIEFEANSDLLAFLVMGERQVDLVDERGATHPLRVTWVGWARPFDHEALRSESPTLPLPLSRDGTDYVLHDPPITDLVRVSEGELAIAPGARPYLVDGTILVDAGSKLVIEPGVRLQFTPGSGIRVRGAIEAQGTAEDPIAFLAADPDAGWANVSIEGEPAIDAPGPELSLFQYCLFAGGRGRRAKADQDDPLVIEPPGEANVAGGAILIYRKRVEILDSVFRDNSASTGGAIFVREGYTGNIRRSLFVHNSVEAVENPGGAAIRLYGTAKTQTHPTIQQNSFVENRASSGAATCGGGVSIGSWSAPDIVNNAFLGNEAVNAGGAIYGYHGNSTFEGLLTVRLRSNLFLDNRAGRGAGNAVRLDLIKQISTLSDNMFVGSQSLEGVEPSSAGTVTLEGTGPVDIIRNSFHSNSQRGGSAGIVAIDPELSSLDIEDSVFEGNRSERAATIEVTGKEALEPEEKTAFTRRTLDRNDFSGNVGDRVAVRLEGSSKVRDLLVDWAREALQYLLKLAVVLLLVAGFALWFPEFVLILGNVLEDVPGTAWLIQALLAIPWMRVRILGPYMAGIRAVEPTLPAGTGAGIERQFEKHTVLIMRCSTSEPAISTAVVRTLAEKSVERVPVAIFEEIDLQKDNFPGAVAASLRRGIQRHQRPGWRIRWLVRLGISNTIVRTLLTSGVLCIVASPVPENRSCFDEVEPINQLYSRSLEYEHSRFLAVVCEGVEVEIENRSSVGTVDCPQPDPR